MRAFSTPLVDSAASMRVLGITLVDSAAFMLVKSTHFLAVLLSRGRLASLMLAVLLSGLWKHRSKSQCCFLAPQSGTVLLFSFVRYPIHSFDCVPVVCILVCQGVSKSLNRKPQLRQLVSRALNLLVAAALAQAWCGLPERVLRWIRNRPVLGIAQQGNERARQWTILIVMKPYRRP